MYGYIAHTDKHMKKSRDKHMHIITCIFTCAISSFFMNPELLANGTYLCMYMYIFEEKMYTYTVHNKYVYIKYAGMTMQLVYVQVHVCMQQERGL